MLDPIVERCRQVREQLLQQYGGLDELFHKLEAMDRQRARQQGTLREKRDQKIRPGQRERRRVKTH